MKALRNQMLVTLCLIAVIFVKWSYGAEYERELTHRIYMEHGMPGVSTDAIVEHIRMAGVSGYNGVLMSEWDLGKIEKQNQKFFGGYARVIAEAKKYKMQVVPGHFSMLSGVYDDHMLAEASPVRGTPFKVDGKTARCASDHSVGLKNGGFESFDGHKPAGWNLSVIGAGTHVFQDKANKHSGVSSLKVMKIPTNARITQKVSVKPFRAYRITAWIKTQALSSDRGVQFEVYGDGGPKDRLLERRWRPFGTFTRWNHFGRTMNWTLCTADFNSMDNRSAGITFCFAMAGYGGSSQPNGVIWLDDLKVEEVGLYETVRRRNHPIVVKSADGSKTYKEGTDYVVDPNCNTFSDNSNYYEGYLKIPAGSSIQNGQMLTVDWYKFSDVYTIYSSTNFCLPEAWDAVRDNVGRIDKLMGHSKRMMFMYDEWRDAFMDDRCELFPHAKTAGEYMGAVLQTSMNAARSVNNGKRELWVYNDMFDPYHNSGNPYYMCVGGINNSWKHTDTSLIIVNWRSHETSFAFHMGLDPKRPGPGNRQLIAVQGASEVPGKIASLKKLEAKGGRPIAGMYWITWYQRWEHIALTANAFKREGWWGNNPLPEPGQAAPLPFPNKVSTKKPEEIPVHTSVPAIRIGKDAAHIEFVLPCRSNVDVQIVNLLGRTVKKVVGMNGQAGVNRMQWNTRIVPAGIYFLELKVNSKAAIRIKHVVM